MEKFTPSATVEEAKTAFNPQAAFDRIDEISKTLDGHDSKEDVLDDATVAALKEERFKLNEDLVSRRS